MFCALELLWARVVLILCGCVRGGLDSIALFVGFLWGPRNGFGIPGCGVSLLPS